MVKKKTTKEIRAIDRIIKFQIDDGIESLTISGKEALADLEIDNKNNVTLYLNADGDKINELTSLVPFINLAVKEEGVDTDKQKSVTLSQDLTQFALEIADNSKELASLIKSESSIILELDGLVQKLLEIAGKLAELEAKNLEQDNRLTELVAKDLEQDNRLSFLENSGNYTQKIITTIQPYYEESFKPLYNAEYFETTHNLKANIGDYTIRDGIVFITIHRYIGESSDGNATVVGMFDEATLSGSGLQQHHIVEMKTISSGNIKIRCELLNNETQQHFKIYDIPNDSNENYKISVHGFNFVPQEVIVPNTPAFD